MRKGFMSMVSLILIACMMLMCIGCGKKMVIDGVERKPVGLISMNTGNIASGNISSGSYSKKVQYEVCWGNVFWGIVLCETVIAPIYFFGFSMFNPIGAMPSNSIEKE